MTVTLILSTKLLALALGLVIFLRAVNVIRKMDMATRKEHYLSWFAFGASYALLAVAAAGAVASILEGPITFSNMTWLAASAGLILFDRRRRRQVVRNPDSTWPPVTTV